MGDILYRELVRGIKNNNETINNYTLLCGDFYYNKNKGTARGWQNQIVQGSLQCSRKSVEEKA